MSTAAVRSLVLAGGASERMGRDKALLVYDGVPQVAKLARMLERLAPPVCVSVRRSQGDDPAFSGLRLLCDQDEGIGPLAGILSAFREDPDSAWLVVAVDLPFLTEATLGSLLDHRDPGAFATAFRNPEIDHPEPVCTVYEPRIAPVLLQAKARGRYTLKILREVAVCLVEPARPEELLNVNDPRQYRQATGQQLPRREAAP